MKRKEKPPVQTQAERIFDKFGGARRIHEVLKEIDRPKALSAIYKWNVPKEKGGTAGRIPSSAMDDIIRAARIYGIYLTEIDLDPRDR